MDPNPEPILPEILPYPYRGSDYTLILDVEDTLIHMEWTVSCPLGSAWARRREGRGDGTRRAGRGEARTKL